MSPKPKKVWKKGDACELKVGGVRQWQPATIIRVLPLGLGYEVKARVSRRSYRAMASELREPKAKNPRVPLKRSRSKPRRAVIDKITLADGTVLKPEKRMHTLKMPAHAGFYGFDPAGTKAVPKPPKPARSAEYLAFVRSHLCVATLPIAADTGFSRHPCSVGGIEAHHFGKHAMSHKCSDYRTVPLCVGHHREYHQTGQISPWTRAETATFFIECQLALLVKWLERGEA